MDDVRQPTTTYEEFEAYVAGLAQGGDAQQGETPEIFWWNPADTAVLGAAERSTAGICARTAGRTRHDAALFQTLLAWLCAPRSDRS